MALAKPHTERARMRIEIFDQTYNVNADGNEEYLTELAAYVDKKMRTISESTQIVDSVKVAVLAALNIADELTSLRTRYDGLYNTMTQTQSVRTRAGSLAGMLDEVLAERKAG